MTSPVTLPQRSPLRHLLATLVAGAIAVVPASAQASCFDTGTCPSFAGGFTLGDGALLSGVFGVISATMGFLPFLATNARWSNVNSENQTLQIYWYSTGGAALGLGALGVGLQAASGSACRSGSTCRAAYGLGAGALGGGALLLALGIYASVTPPQRTPQAWLVPTPLLIPTEHGPAVGLGLSGITF